MVCPTEGRIRPLYMITFMLRAMNWDTTWEATADPLLVDFARCWVPWAPAAYERCTSLPEATDDV